MVSVKIFTDGRRLPSGEFEPWCTATRGPMEGDTLVVESIGFKDPGLAGTNTVRRADDNGTRD
jgi:hypothetical protein